MTGADMPPSTNDSGIAIIGMAGRFPGANSVDELWRNIRDGVESITRFSDDELLAAGVDPAVLADPSYVKAGAVLDDIESFDAAFFGLTPREAEILDPQQRLFLEAVWNAFESAGCDPARYEGSIGVFAGGGLSTYFLNNLALNPEVWNTVGSLPIVLGNDKDSLATRAAYLLDLTGPSYTVQTYCSTSLVAVSVACENLLSGVCDMALAGGVMVSVPHRVGYSYQEGGIASPDARCRAFDARAKGSPLGNGVAAVLLKRLSDAIADGDTIHAVIKGWAVNNDGGLRAGFTAPGTRGQTGVILEALANADLHAEDISYIEAHGTGTALGDAIEFAAMVKAFGEYTDKREFCAVGSVKTNLGHLDRAAGATSLIKTALALEHRLLPPSLNYDEPNPQIDFRNTPFYINTELQEWTAPAGQPRRAGVSSFGIGGTNAHVILEEAPALPSDPSGRPCQLLLLSAKTAAALESATNELASYLRQQPDIDMADVAYTLQVGRQAFEHRRMLVCIGREDAIEALEARDPVRLQDSAGATIHRPIAFLFPDAREAYPGMVRNLYEREPVFRETVDRCCELVRPLLGPDLRDVLLDNSERSSDDRLHSPEVAEPAAFIAEYALAALLGKWGIVPEALLGNGAGEYVAACLAGVFSLEDALSLVVLRGRLLATQSAVTMDDFRAHLSRIVLNPPKIRCLSSITGRWLTDDEAIDPEYWAQQLRGPSRLQDSLDELLRDANRILLEVGPVSPHPLAPSPQRGEGGFWEEEPARGDSLAHLQGLRSRAQSRLRAPLPPGGGKGMGDEGRSVALTSLLGTLGRLWLAGHDINWTGYYGEERRRRIPLPTYPFERRRYWIDPAPRLPAPAQPASTGKKPDPVDWFYEPVWKASPRAGAPGDIDGTWLLFMATENEEYGIAPYLRRHGASVIEVRMGERFVQLSDAEFLLRPDIADDYKALLQTLEREGRLPEHIVHLWSLEKAEGNSFRHVFEAAQRSGFYSLLHLTQALAGRNVTSTTRISVVTRELHPVDGPPLHPEHATLASLCRVIQQENQNIRCRLIDISPSSLEEQVAELAAELAAELTAGATEPAVAFRGGERHVERFTPTRPSGATPLRPGGVYLITGGLGGVGLVLAGHLVRRYGAKLVLTGRSGLPPRESWGQWLADHAHDERISGAIRAIQELEEAGAEVLVLAADAADVEQMRWAVQQTHERFGALHGVIHAAGLTSISSLQAVQTTDSVLCEAHFRPKVSGLLALEEALQGRDLDFCLVFSSLSSVLGGLGFAAYAAANHFMDRYIQARRDSLPGKWISVSWDTWQVGDQDLPAASMADFAMTPAEGVRAFELALSGEAGHLIHSTGDLDARFRQWVLLEGLKGGSSGAASHARPSLATEYVAAGTEIEQRIQTIWREALGIEEIGINDNFFDLGGNSLIGLQVVARLQKEFGVQLSVVVLFEAPTVSALAERLRPKSNESESTEVAALIERRRAARRGTDEDGIAIIAMAGRFPGANNVDELWQNLCGGVESVSRFSDEELLAEGIDPALIRQSNYVKARPIIQNADRFDAAFFGYSPREAEILDPQHRVFLECAWEVLELAGYNPTAYDGLVGVFAGANISTYLLSWLSDPQLARSVNSFQAVISSDKDSLPTITSYKLNLRGPSMAVQTFCSTSLVATHMACESLLRGECDIALAGGVSIRVPQKQGYLYEEGGQESPDGHCRTFDAQARGSLFGDGAGVVALKRLKDALEDGDQIHAVIKGSAVNNDGSLKVGYTAPSVTGQAAAVSMAIERAGVHPEEIGYVEAHGTATELGDPIEVEALTQAYRRHTPKTGYCAIGSLKTNMGHLDRAAGVTGLIKAALAVREGILPATLHYRSPNPEIDFTSSPFYVNAELTPWNRARNAKRIAAVNSLGMGGTNAHVIVEEPPASKPSGPARAWHVIPLSARTPEALDTSTRNFVQYLQDHPDANLADVAYTMSVGRHCFDHRRTVVCRDVPDALQALESLDPGRVLTHAQTAIKRRVVFMFPGVGDHYVQMGRELYDGEPVFREAIERCCATLYPYLGNKLRDILYPGGEPGACKTSPVDMRAMLGRHSSSPTEEYLSQTAIAQPVVFAIEYALAQLLLSWGFRPDAMVGYSLGEYVAACLAGVLSLDDALKLVAERARLIQELPAGAMLAVALSAEAVQPYLNDEVSLAIHNSASMCVLAGSPVAIARLERRLQADEVAFRRLETAHAFHSSMMEPLIEPVTALASGVTLNPPSIPYLSNVTGTWMTPEGATDPTYWAQHMRGTVRFYQALDELLQDKESVLIEVGPGQSLSSFAKQHPRCHVTRIGRIVPTMRSAYERRSDLEYLLGTVARLWLTGMPQDWPKIYAGQRRRRVALPTYPFERQRYWLTPSKAPAQLGGAPQQGDTPAEVLSALPRRPLDDWFYLPAWKQSAPRLPRKEEDTHWLLFIDDVGLGEGLARRLKQEGNMVMTVEAGSRFARLSAGRYIMRPESREDHAALLRDLQERGQIPTRIVHLWSTTDQDAVSQEETLELGLFSLMYLAQLCTELDLPPYDISIVSNDIRTVSGRERLLPEKATVLGACRVIPLEYPNILCRSIDVELETLGSRQGDALLSNLLGELQSDIEDRVVALRGHQRWVQTFEPLPLPAQTHGSSPFRPHGVYLITGGLGGIGLAVAEHLARTQQARLVLVSRSGLPPRERWEQLLSEHGEEDRTDRQIRQVQHLEALGAEVLAAAADVSDAAQVRAVVTAARERFGTIHGVIHAAGVPGLGLIQLKSPELASQVLAPKIKGTLALEEALAGLNLDFLVLFSSITSATGGGPGQLDYCAANAFLDAYAQRQAEGDRLTVAIDWGEWQWNAWEEGLAGFPEEVQTFFRENRRRIGIGFDEGCEALERILARGLPQVVVSTQDFVQLAELSKHFTIKTILNWGRPEDTVQARHPRPSLGTSYVSPRDELEVKLAAIWGDILGIEEIGINDNFFDLGGNSLIGLDLVSRLRRELRLEDIPAHVLYEAPSISALARYVRKDQHDAAMIAGLQARGERQREALSQRRRPIRTEAS